MAEEPDEFALRRDLERASRAEALVNNEMLNEAFDTVERNYFDAWKKTAPTNAIGLERLHTACTIIGAVRNEFVNVISNGTMARAHLAMLEATKKRGG